MGHRSGLPDLIAVHDDGRAARETIERLSRAGVDGGAIQLLGSREVVTAGRYGDRQVDRGSSLALGARVLRGIGWGIPPGAVFGMILLAVASEPSREVVLAGAAGGAGLGASIGILVALLTIPTMASSWERTFAPMVPGGVAVGVRVGDERTRRRALPVLRGCAAHSLLEIVDLDDYIVGDEGRRDDPDDP